MSSATDWLYRLRTDTKYAFWFGLIFAGILATIGGILYFYVPRTEQTTYDSESHTVTVPPDTYPTPDTTTVLIVVGLAVGFSLFVGGVFALRAYMYKESVATYKKQGFTDSEARREAMADTRANEMRSSNRLF